MSNFHIYYYTWPEVCQMTTLSETNIRTMQPKGTFPWHLELSGGRVGFPKEVIHAWLENPKAWKLRNLQLMREAFGIPDETTADNSFNAVFEAFARKARSAEAAMMTAILDRFGKLARGTEHKSDADNPTDASI